MAGDPGQRLAFREMWTVVVEPVTKFVNELIDQEKPPEHLIHFTDAAGLLGIIKNKNLRLGRASASNDPRELEHGVRLARAEIRRQMLADPDFAIFGREMILGFEGKRSDGVEGLKIDPHICCFTPGDSAKRIGHWAMYGRNGAGFALRFRTEPLAGC